MPVHLKQSYGRIVAARQRLVDVRAARWETLQRFKNFAKAKLADFVGTTDPVSGQRYADVAAGGDKARGEAAMVLSFFEGTKLRLTVDSSAQYGFECTPPEIMADVARIVDILVPPDLSRAELVYEAVNAPHGARRKLDLYDVIARLVDCAAVAVEEQLGDAGNASTPTVTAQAAAAPAGKPVFSFSVG